ncbi:hypothetical protein NKH77_40340 [Streptomyces sp. M19]
MRRVFAPLTAAALLVGCWTQAGALAYAVGPGALPGRCAPPLPARLARPALGGRPRPARRDRADRGLPRAADAAGLRRVHRRPAYPDPFLPDEARRWADTRRYFAAGTPRADRLAVLRAYHVGWVLQWPSDGGLDPRDSALRPSRATRTGAAAAGDFAAGHRTADHPPRVTPCGPGGLPDRASPRPGSGPGHGPSGAPGPPRCPAGR